MWRAAAEEEDDAIIELCVALYEEDPASEPVPREHHVRTLSRLRAETVRGRVSVLEIDSALCGYAILISYWSNELGGEICTIDEVYVIASQRNRGHTSALIESIARGDGPWPSRPVALELEVTPDNARARALYERLGFAQKRNTTMRMKTRA